MKACRIWTGATDQSGYGIRKIGSRPAKDRRVERVHRLAYLEAHELEEIPEGLCVLHLCDTPACYEPTHLTLGTKAQNSQEKRERNPFDRRGERNHRARITAGDAEEIRALARSGHTQREIGDRYGLSQSHVSAIVRGERWASTSSMSDSPVSPVNMRVLTCAVRGATVATAGQATPWVSA